MSTASASAAIRLLVIPGSVRKGSVNLQLAKAVANLGKAQGAEATVYDLRALQLPIYDGDLESASGQPAAATEFLKQVIASDALIFVTPEYNSFPTPLLINSMDWLSRVPAKDGLPSGSQALANKPTGIMSASPGAMGGIRSLTALRGYLSAFLGMLVVPQQFALGSAMGAFNEDGSLKDPKAAQRVVEGVIHVASKMR